MGSVRIDRLDHLVLTVADIDATVEFYTRVLGMKAVTFGTGRTALAFGRSKINLHQAGHEFEPKAHRPAPGSADLCLPRHPGSNGPTLRTPRSAVLAWAGWVCSRIARYHLRGVNRGAGASASMTVWW